MAFSKHKGASVGQGAATHAGYGHGLALEPWPGRGFLQQAKGKRSQQTASQIWEVVDVVGVKGCSLARPFATARKLWNMGGTAGSTTTTTGTATTPVVKRPSADSCGKRLDQASVVRRHRESGLLHSEGTNKHSYRVAVEGLIFCANYAAFVWELQSFNRAEFS